MATPPSRAPSLLSSALLALALLFVGGGGAGSRSDGVGVVHVAAQFPIPRSYAGFAYGPQPRERVVVLEAFYDLTCPSCRAGWPGVRDAIAFYGSKLRFVLHPFVLPFHHNSYVAAKAIHAVAAVNVSKAFDWLEVIFTNQDEFSTEATWHTAPADVIKRFAQLIEENLGIPQTTFLAAYDSNAAEINARISFKYGCSRAVYQTPSYYVNGVPVGADDSWTLEDWKKLLNSIVFGPAAAAGGASASAGIEHA